MRTATVSLVCTFVLACSVTACGAEAPNAYTTHCASCHGADGRGKTPAGQKLEMPDLRSKKVQDLSDDALYETIALGVGHKQYPHAFIHRGLKEPQIRDIVKYLRTLAVSAK